MSMCFVHKTTIPAVFGVSEETRSVGVMGLEVGNEGIAN
jgi:hypothetical protein